MRFPLLPRLLAVLVLFAAMGCELIAPENVARGSSGSSGSSGGSGSSGSSGSSGGSGSGGITGGGCFRDAGLPSTTAFGPFTPLLVEGYMPAQARAGDVSGDGRPDVVITVAAGHIETFVQFEDGGFDAFDEGTGQIDGGIWSDFAIADWNGDGLADLIVPDTSFHVGGQSRIAVLLAHGTPGRFTIWGPPTFSNYNGSDAPFSAVAAVDGASPEAYTLTADGQTLVLWRPEVDGGGTAIDTYEEPIGPFPNLLGRVVSLSSGYFNADGTRAIAFAGEQNDADGGSSGYAGGQFDTADTGVSGFLAPSPPGTTLLRVSDVGPAGRGLDANVLYQQGAARYVQVFRSGPGETSSDPVQLPACADPALAMVSGDFDGDGNRDVAVGVPGTEVLVLRGLADGGLGQVEALHLPVVCNGFLSVADFDGDGRDDLVTPCAAFHGALIYPGR